MKIVRYTLAKKLPIIVVEFRFLWFRIEKEYRSASEFPKGYHEWINTKTGRLVGDSLSFNLDALWKMATK